MNDEKILLPDMTPTSTEKKSDLDDFIFNGEGWQISDR